MMCADRGPWLAQAHWGPELKHLLLFLFHYFTLMPFSDGQLCFLPELKQCFCPKLDQMSKRYFSDLHETAFYCRMIARPGSGRISSWAGIMRSNDGQNIELSYYWLSSFRISTAFISPESKLRPLGQYITGCSQGCSIWVRMLGLLRF